MDGRSVQLGGAYRSLSCFSSSSGWAQWPAGPGPGQDEGKTALETQPAPVEIVFMVDLHWTGRQPLQLPDLTRVHLVLLGGDIAHFRGPRVVRQVVDQIQKKGPRVLAVCGNCDLPESEAYLAQAGIGLDQKAVELDGLTVAGLSAGLPFGGCPYERTENEYLEACRHLPSSYPNPSILVSHQPPFNTACDCTRGQHVGSRAIRDYILKAQPDLVLSGHIHESIGTDELGTSRLANPGPWAAGRLLRVSLHEGRLGPVRIDQVPR